MKEKLLNLTDNSHYEGVYDEKDGRTEMQWGKYDYGVSKDCQEPDLVMLADACKKFNTESNTHYAIAEYSDKYNVVTLYTYKALSEHDSAYEKVMKGNKEVAAKVKLAGFSNQKIDDKIDAELKALKAKLKIVKALSKEVGFNVLEKNYDSLMNLFSSTIRRYKFSIKFDDNSFVKEFNKNKPAVFIYSPQYIYATKTTVTNVDLPALTMPQTRFVSIYTWYAKKDHVWKIFTNNK